EILAAAPSKESAQGPRRDPFADFREDAETATASVLSLMPLSGWARREEPAVKRNGDTVEAGGELSDLFAALSLPPHVAGVTYGRGCRIRRVRVPASAGPGHAGTPHPVIVSKRALDELRAT